MPKMTFYVKARQVFTIREGEGMPLCTVKFGILLRFQPCIAQTSNLLVLGALGRRVQLGRTEFHRNQGI